MSEKKVALVTGASRGSGRNCAIWLARSGFDLAITARTVEPGEAREHSTTIHRSDTSPLPGSLAETASTIRKGGGQCAVVPADILDEESLESAVSTVLQVFGRIDVLVHSARYVGPGHMDGILDTPTDVLMNAFRGNVLAPFFLNQRVIPLMAEQGGGVIIHVTSAAAFSDPVREIGSGGWGASYGVTKAGVHRLTGYVVIEHALDNILCFNLQPGTVATERVPEGQEGPVAEVPVGSNLRDPIDVVGAAVAWLATSPDAPRLNGRTIEAPFLCLELGLLAHWTGPGLNPQGRHDVSAEMLTAMEAALAEGRPIPSHFAPGSKACSAISR